MDKLKPCPHCGENKLGVKTHSHLIIRIIGILAPNSFSIRCQNCGALGPPCSTWKEAQQSWDERACKIWDYKRSDLFSLIKQAIANLMGKRVLKKRRPR